MAHEAGHIVRPDHAVLQQLGAADDALKRGLQLMGDVGGELAAVALGVGLLGDVEGQQHRAHHLAVGLDTGHVELVLAAVALHTGLAVAGVHGIVEGVADGAAALHGQQRLAHAGRIGVEHGAGGRVHAEDGAAVIHQYQALGHAGGDLFKLLGPAAQRTQLIVDLTPLVLQSAQQGRKLLIGVVFQGVLQVQGVQGAGDAAGHAAGQNAGEDQGHGDDRQDGGEHTQKQHAHGDAAGGQAQDRAVRQAAGVVEGLFQQSGAVTAGLTGAVGQGLTDLLALGVVLHGRSVSLRIIEHRAVGAKPGDAVIVGVQLGQIGLAVAGLHGRSGDGQLIPELLLLDMAEIGVQCAHDNDQTGQQHRKPHRHGGAKYLFCHMVSSQR